MSKATRFKILVLTERIHHKECACRNIKALPLLVQKLWQRIKFLEMYVNGHGQGHKIIDLGVNGKGFIS